jgi:hypothetical protein
VGVGKFTITRAALNAGAFSASVPDTPVTVVAIVAGTCWWSGTFSGAGTQGCLVIYNAGNSTPGGRATDGNILAYDPVARSWFFNQSGMSPFYGTAGYAYHEVAAYSAIKNCMVYGGGNDNPTKIWRLNSNGSFTPMPDVPAGKELGIQRGNLVADPASGNFLLLSANELWELDPSGAGAWRQQTGSRLPPADVGRPGPAAVGPIDGVVSCAIPEYGVIVYIKQTSPTNSALYLYKHA